MVCTDVLEVCKRGGFGERWPAGSARLTPHTQEQLASPTHQSSACPTAPPISSLACRRAVKLEGMSATPPFFTYAPHPDHALCSPQTLPPQPRCEDTCCGRPSLPVTPSDLERTGGLAAHAQIPNIKITHNPRAQRRPVSAHPP